MSGCVSVREGVEEARQQRSVAAWCVWPGGQPARHPHPYPSTPNHPPTTHTPPTRHPPTSMSLQIDSMNRYCHLPWKRDRRKLRRSSVELVASRTATWELSAGGRAEQDRRVGGCVVVDGARCTCVGELFAAAGAALGASLHRPPTRRPPPRPNLAPLPAPATPPAPPPPTAAPPPPTAPTHPAPAMPPCRPAPAAGPGGAGAAPPGCGCRRTRRPAPTRSAARQAQQAQQAALCSTTGSGRQRAALCSTAHSAQQAAAAHGAAAARAWRHTSAGNETAVQAARARGRLPEQQGATAATCRAPRALPPHPPPPPAAPCLVLGALHPPPVLPHIDVLGGVAQPAHPAAAAGSAGSRGRMQGARQGLARPAATQGGGRPPRRSAAAAGPPSCCPARPAVGPQLAEAQPGGPLACRLRLAWARCRRKAPDPSGCPPGCPSQGPPPSLIILLLCAHQLR